MNPKKAKEFIKPAAEKAEVSEKLANSLINFYWNRVRKEINDVKHYNITIENLGTFKLKHWKIDEIIDKYKKKVSKMEGSFVQFTFKKEKVRNRFIFSSRCERGLIRILELWPEIIKNKPDAELYFCTYTNFPENDIEKKIESTINSFESIKFMGNTNRQKLYEYMSTLSTCEFMTMCRLLLL